MPDGRKQNEHVRRMRAACAILGLTLDELARRCGVSGPHLRFVALGERKPSARLVDALKRELGDDGWAFARHQTDTLRVPNASLMTGTGSNAEEV